MSKFVKREELYGNMVTVELHSNLRELKTSPRWHLCFGKYWLQTFFYKLAIIPSSLIYYLHPMEDPLREKDQLVIPHL